MRCVFIILIGLSAGAARLFSQADPSPNPAVSAVEQQLTVRERAQGIVESDQRFLEKIEATGTPPPSTGPTRARPSATQPKIPSNKPAREAPELEPARSTDVGEGITEQEAHDFVQSYLRIAQGDNPTTEASLYADRVRYFDSGMVSREFIEKDQRSYYRRWPDRSFTLLDKPTLVNSSGDTATVKFRMEYRLGNSGKSSSGKTEEALRLKRSNGGIKIVGINERKL